MEIFHMDVFSKAMPEKPPGVIIFTRNALLHPRTFVF